jgi:Coenzyme F420-dependent N5,N10-methylene tetrahydromethanopterin reductase and related flavin-dependent oxidoreductases
MLPHYSPLKVAEVFSMLSGLHPGRIDLGIGRAPEPIRTRCSRCSAIAGRRLPTTSPSSSPNCSPCSRTTCRRTIHSRGSPRSRRPERPEVWLLGSSPQSAIWAAELGLPYSFADFINPKGAELAQLYRDRFRPSVRRDTPWVAAAVSTICAETDEEAHRLASSARMAIALLHSGRLIPVPRVETALAFFDAREVPPTGRRAVVGSPQTVRRGSRRSRRTTAPTS